MPVVVVDGGGGVVGVAFSCVPNGWFVGWLVGRESELGPKCARSKISNTGDEVTLNQSHAAV